MFRQIVQDFGEPSDFWCDLAGCSDLMFSEWIEGTRKIPRSVARTFSQATGIDEAAFLSTEDGTHPGRSIPSFWLRAKQAGLPADLRTISYARLLAENHWDLLGLLGRQAPAKVEVLQAIADRANPSDTPQKQGVDAAAAFLEFTTLEKGQRGIGEVLRGCIRSLGVFILETPLNETTPQGFCLLIGEGRACIIANTYGTSWFHRNLVILHELCHAVFEIPDSAAEFDKRIEKNGKVQTKSFAEQRAEAFATNALVSRKLLMAYWDRGLPIPYLNAPGLAKLMAEVHAEPALILRAACQHGLITTDDYRRQRSNLPNKAQRAEASPHAKSLAELTDDERQTFLRDPALFIAPSAYPRKTTFPINGMRLPLPFIRDVLEALNNGLISYGKAQELMMNQDLSKFSVGGLQAGV